MKLIYTGKTKNIFELDDGNILLKFKDDATGADGVFDPGANTVGVTIDGLGKDGLMITEYYYNKLTKLGIFNHFVSANIDKGEMIVKPAKVFGKGLEVVCRLRAVGSFLRRYGDYAKPEQPLDYLIEITLKDDKREDPLITKDSLLALGILTEVQYNTLVESAKKVAKIVSEDLASKNAELYDIKFEYGIIDDKIALIDEISGGNMRVKHNGEYLQPLQFRPLILGK